MGFISGDNIGTIIVGKDITTNAPVVAFDAPGGQPIDTIPAGTYLGRANNVKDNTIFMFGSWWLSFPTPYDYLGVSGNVTGPFWVEYNPSALLVDDKPPRDNSLFNGLPEPIANIFGSLENMIVTLIVVLLLLAATFFLISRYKK